MTYLPHFLKLRAVLSTAPVVILIRDRRASRLKGTVSASMLSAFSDVARTYAIDHAMITVRNSAGSAVICFSGPFPEPARQRIRNIWFSFPQRKAMKV